MRVSDKLQMYDLLSRGKLGNTLQLWNSPEEMFESGFVGKYAIRCKLPQREFLPNLDFYTLGDYMRAHKQWRDYLSRNNLSANMAILAAMDIDGGRRIITGELTRYPLKLVKEPFVNYNKSDFLGYSPLEWGITAKQLVLHYSYADKLYRDAMRESRTAYGIVAQSILSHYLDEYSCDTLTELLDEYDDAVIEFTLFERPLGIFNKRLVIWEVRSDY